MALEKAVLLLEDGTCIYGNAFGKNGLAFGELCFTTGMTGYQEVFTDPSYCGQVLIMNSVHVGNYGIYKGEVESKKVQVKAVIGRNLESFYSRVIAEESLEDYFIRENIVAITGVDTRALVLHVRKNGAMNCIVSSTGENIDSLKNKFSEIPSMQGLELASITSTLENYEEGKGNNLRVSILDLGIKKEIINCLTERGVHVKVFNAKSGFKDLKAFNPHGYFVSNGPGDPSSMDYAISTIKSILEDGKPMFGICLGHQLLAIANGIPTFKMHHGHRGLNHPVKNLITGKCELTTQNHGFGIESKAVENNNEVEITHINLNDNSIEGIRMKNKKAFSVQYHPEATPGPHDSRYLFDDFIEMIKEN